ncbi:murein transglycosylase A [Desulforhopalus sp. 52FAK]
MTYSPRTIATLCAVISVLITTFFLWFYDPYKPLHKVSAPSPLFDDMDSASLLAVIERQKHYLEKLPSGSTYPIGEYSVTNDWLLTSLLELRSFLKTGPSEKELENFLTNNYEFFQAGGRKNKWGRKMLVTGYYEPLFKGSLTPTPIYTYPLYSPPKSLVKQIDSQQKTVIGRYDETNHFTSFWSREEIETALHLAGNELVYLKDPFDAYLLHVQGSGKIQFPDGSIRSIGFAGTNGLEYKSIGKILVDTNIMKLADVNIPAIRKYLEDHPSERIPLLHQNPRYIFFRWGDNKGPRGSLGEPLTAGRSIAIDPKSLPTGTIAYLHTMKPVLGDDQEIVSWEPMKRLVFPQDSGSAIKGTGRVDVFWGNGVYAETAANHMKHPGKLYFLIKKGVIKADNK